MASNISMSVEPPCQALDAIRQHSLLLPYQRDDVKKKVRIWL